MEIFGEESHNGRRTLLIIYIHGFMGADSSFQSFPAHLHDLLKLSLESHVIHTKIYPRYKTYKAIDVATENFSKWLAPHESPTTDIILVGHSMGGLLAADLVLLPPVAGTRSNYPFRHRILGTISLDTPFLGLHPGIIAAGIASLFRKAPDPAKKSSGPSTPNFPPLSPQPSASSSAARLPAVGELTDLSPLPSPESSTAALSYFPSNSGSVNSTQSDPYYNPPFFNDIMFKDRGWMKNMWHFAKKRKIEGSSLIEAATNHIVCHLQFGRCLADMKGLHTRYGKIRHLESVDDFDMSSGRGGPRREARVRFVNYYTISTGRIKTPKAGSPALSPARSPGRTPAHSPPRSPYLRPTSPGLQRGLSGGQKQPSSAFLNPESGSIAMLQQPDSRSSTPRISIEDYSDTMRPKLLEVIDSEDRQGQLNAPRSTPAESSGAETSSSKGPSDPTTDSSNGSGSPGAKSDLLEEAGSESGDSCSSLPDLTEAAPIAMSESDTEYYDAPDTPAAVEPTPPVADTTENKVELGLHDGLKPVPDVPEAPGPPDPGESASTDERKAAEKEHRKVQKEYEQAVKARERVVKENEKTIEKRRGETEKENKKKEKEEHKRQQQEERKREKEEQQRLKKEKEEQQRLKKEKEDKKEAEGQSEGEMKRLEEERKRMDAEGQRMEAERKRMEEESRRMLGGTSSPPRSSDVGGGAAGAHEGQREGVRAAAEQEQDREQDREREREREREEDSSGEESPARQSLSLRQAVEGVVKGQQEHDGQQPMTTRLMAEDDGGLQGLKPQGSPSAGGKKKDKPKRLRKFCTLPKKRNGARDPAWVEVYMEGVDEVGAHCGLFFSGPHYERLVGDVGMRILGWVQEDASRRAILE